MKASRYIKINLAILVALYVLGCSGDVSVSVPGCEECPERCLVKENGPGKCVACLKDVHCQGTGGATKKCNKDNRCICGSDKDCPERQFCKGVEGCVECLTANHCKERYPDKSACVANRCETCAVNDSRACAPQGVNVCAKGTQTCKPNSTWGKCENVVVCKEFEKCVEQKCVLDCPSPAPCKENERTCVSATGVVPGAYKTCVKDKKGCFQWSEEKPLAEQYRGHLSDF